MNDTFGMNGYICQITPVEGGFRLSAWHPKYANTVRADKTIKSSQLDEGTRVDDRAQSEKLFQPLFDELDAKYEKLGDKNPARAGVLDREAPQGVQDKREGAQEANNPSVNAPGDVMSRPDDEADGSKKVVPANPDGLKAEDGTSTEMDAKKLVPADSPEAKAVGKTPAASADEK